MAQNLSQPSGWKGSTVTDPTRPRVYTGFFDGSNEAERQFLAALPKVAKFINDRLKAGGYAFDVHQAEIATNFIGEGGYYPLHWNYWQHIDGFGALGIDTFVQRRQALKRWVPDSVMKLADDPHHVGKTLNEKRETVTFLTDLDMEQGLYANAGMFALCIATAANTANESLPLKGGSPGAGTTVPPSNVPGGEKTPPGFSPLLSLGPSPWTVVVSACAAGPNRPVRKAAIPNPNKMPRPRVSRISSLRLMVCVSWEKVT